jgi:hypothetical protein
MDCVAFCTDLHGVCLIDALLILTAPHAVHVCGVVQAWVLTRHAAWWRSSGRPLYQT